MRWRTIYLETAAWEMEMPSFASSPCTRGAPQRGLALLMFRLSSRISRATLGRPDLRRRLFQVQYRLNPERCQRTTPSRRARSASSWSWMIPTRSIRSASAPVWATMASLTLAFMPRIKCHDSDDARDGDNIAENGQQGAKLVRPHRVEGEPDGLEKLRHDYSPSSTFTESPSFNSRTER